MPTKTNSGYQYKHKRDKLQTTLDSVIGLLKKRNFFL